MHLARKPWLYAVVYTGLSLAVEIFLLVVLRLKIPEDNRLIAPVILILPPVLAAWTCGFRQRKELAMASLLGSFLTLALTILAGRLTGISTGLGLPTIVRSLAGYLAAWITVKTCITENINGQGGPQKRG